MDYLWCSGRHNFSPAISRTFRLLRTGETYSQHSPFSQRTTLENWNAHVRVEPLWTLRTPRLWQSAVEKKREKSRQKIVRILILKIVFSHVATVNLVLGEYSATQSIWFQHGTLQNAFSALEITPDQSTDCHLIWLKNKIKNWIIAYLFVNRVIKTCQLLSDNISQSVEYWGKEKWGMYEWEPALWIEICTL